MTRFSLSISKFQLSKLTISSCTIKPLEVRKLVKKLSLLYCALFSFSLEAKDKTLLSLFLELVSLAFKEALLIFFVIIFMLKIDIKITINTIAKVINKNFLLNFFRSNLQLNIYKKII